ncbi:MAG: hypothetical protein QM504_04690 [Pseudomonadota bacterium]
MANISKSPVNFSKHENIISSIYDAAIDNGEWSNVLNKLASISKSELGVLRIINLKNNLVGISYVHNKDISYEKMYKEYYINIDPWLNLYLKKDDTFLSCTHYHLTNKEYENTEYYSGLIKPQDIHYGMGGKIHINKNQTAFIAFNRSKKSLAFEESDLELLLQLVPHIQRSLLISEKINKAEFKRNSLKDTLNQINNPVILVDKKGRLLFISQQAEHLINMQQGVCIKHNHIFIKTYDDNVKLYLLINQATQSNDSQKIKQSGAMEFRSLDRKNSICILVYPINSDVTNIDTNSRDNVLLILSDNNHKKSISEDLIKGLYHFTSAEARLASLLCQGLTLDEIALFLSLSKNTIRSQLRACFNKTGTSRQIDLLSLIVGGPAGSINIEQ